MFAERRQYKRQTINRLAKFVTEPGGLPRSCMITDISERGARLFSETSDMPDSFQLLISGETPIRHDCCVVWRLGGEVGVTFVTEEREQERLKAMKEFQSRLRNAFRQAG